MVNHRAQRNHALDAAISLGNHLGLPVVCYHALRPDYPHASDRIHQFVLDGLAGLGHDLEARGVPYFLEINPLPGLNPDYSDMVILAGLMNISYETLITRIVNAALKRHQLA